jgi:hypothetical protein
MSPNRNLAQRLVQGNRGIQDGIENANAPGGDPSQWILKSMEKSPKPNIHLYPYIDRYYLTFDDGSGSSVKISGNYDPNSGRWDGPTFHFSSDQPNPAKWGPDGAMRNPLDRGAHEDPTIENIDDWLDLFEDE